MKIVIAEKISPAAISLFTEEPGWNVLTAEQVSGNLPSELADADALIVRSAVQADADLLQHAGKLRVIGRAGVGVDNIDLDAATNKGIAVMNTPGANAVAVAEHTLGLMLVMARHLCRANELMHAGKWEKKSLQGSELRGKTLGVLGLGRIGVEVAKRALAFGMRVAAYDPFVPPTVAEQAGVDLKPLDDVLKAADYLSLHMALTPQTSGIIGAETISKMKKGVRIVNCARGELVDEAAVAAAIKEGHIAGMAADVFREEPPKTSPLIGLPQVIATPHIAGSTNEAQDAVGIQIAQQVKEYLKHGVIQNAVNVPSMTEEEYQQTRPFMILGGKLGAFVAQVTNGRPEQVTIRYTGDLGRWKTELVKNSVVMGILNVTLAGSANLVNASKIAAERGVQIMETRKERAGGGAANTLSIELRAGSETHEMRGTVLHSDQPRLLAVDGIDVEAPLGRNLLYMRNQDVPGVIGNVGTILGDNKVNIADFSLGRRGDVTSKGSAIGIVHLDGPVSEAVVEKIREVAAVVEARAVVL
ncbi:MAG: phosphoglycerate dehydrogenase [Terriglobia bacterium]|jgi:D-3-phosphoglycerate dehydrogenase|nr:phosphoglycerate dehydrogenase [Terriglobia bacterium]